MKKVYLFVSMLVLVASSVFAVQDTITFKRNVTFNHKAHADMLKQCTKCHTTEQGGKVEGFGKEVAHDKVCMPCHVEMKRGPVKKDCKVCHKPQG